MDWTKQNEKMFKSWTDAQTRMWKAYSDSIAGFGKSPGERVWEKMIATGEELVKNSLAAQAEWMKTWTENFKALEGMPAGGAEALNQFQEMMVGWAATQEKLWTAWFDMLKQFDTSQFSGAPNDPFQVWQESTKQVMNMQMDWARNWMDQFKTGQED